jgi:hypothetical protein
LYKRLLIGAVVATAMGYWRDAGIPLAFMGIFWFFDLSFA